MSESVGQIYYCVLLLLGDLVGNHSGVELGDHERFTLCRLSDHLGRRDGKLGRGTQECRSHLCLHPHVIVGILVNGRCLISEDSLHVSQVITRTYFVQRTLFFTLGSASTEKLRKEVAERSLLLELRGGSAVF